MAQDAPADTAGPSSPPPRLPDGWLPQWEGVQRQWYYVQRATGKSQWDIPTEPVVLTPSTTPTSIGTGPSQAPPSRPSTNSPCVTATGNSLVERMESAADKARFSSSLSSQLNDQPNTSIGTPGTLGWHSAHNVKHGSQSHTQPFPSGSGEYAASQFHQTVLGNPDHRPFYTDQGHYPVQTDHQPTWGSHGPMTQMFTGGPTADPTIEQYRGFPMDAQQQSQMSAYAHSIAYPGNQRGGFVQPGFSPSQSEWQIAGHHPKSSRLPQPSSDQYGLSNLSQHFYGSHPIPQTGGQHLGEPASRSSQPSISYLPGSTHSGNQVEMQEPRGSLSAQSHGNANQGNNNIASHPLSRSQSYQSAGFRHDQQDILAAGSHAQPSVHGYGHQLPNDQSTYQSTDVSRAQLGPGFNSTVFPAAQSAHGGAQHYQNPIVQAGVHHYLPQQPQSSTQGDVTNQNRASYHPHSSQSAANPVNQGQWPTSASASRIAASDPQFVSGPWASSTPPTSGPPQQLHYG